MIQVARRREGGIALITALLVVALASIAAAAVAAAGFTSLSRTQLLLDTERAWWYAQGMEDWAISILQRDAEDNDIDHLGEVWAMELPPLPVDGGTLHGELRDAQGRFNLNNLAADDPERAIEQFVRLLECAGAADPFTGREIANAVTDWVDPDEEQRFPGGGEDLLYLGKTPPYRTANGIMMEVSELRAVSGIDGDIYRALLPHVAALPSETPVNVNTATPEVLCSLSEDPEFRSRIDSFVDSRVDAPLEEINVGTDDGRLFPASEHGIVASDVSVDTEYFYGRAEAFIGNAGVVIYSLVTRPSAGPPIVLRRSTSSR